MFFEMKFTITMLLSDIEKGENIGNQDLINRFYISFNEEKVGRNGKFKLLFQFPV
jgi:hypothetical protein